MIKFRSVYDLLAFVYNPQFPS